MSTATSTASPAFPPRAKEPVILLIEDEPDLADLEQSVLEGEKLLVVTARDGERALRLLRFFEPDLVVTDLMMPVCDGFEFLERYRAETAAPAPVIAISAFQPYVDQALEMGVAAGFLKPLDFPRMLGTIRELLSDGAVRRPELRGQRRLPPDDECARLREIFDLRLDTVAPERSLHDFVQLVGAHFDVPIALISIVTEDRQFWTAGCGLPPDLASDRGTRREDSFCTHAVAARAALVVQDAHENPFFKDNPIVKGRGLRFYAGVPLVSRNGEAVGTLCLLDFRPRAFTHLDLELLTAFGHCVLGAFELRERRSTPGIPEGAFRYLEHVDEDLEILGKPAFLEVAVLEGARAAAAHEPLSCIALAVPARRLKGTVSALRARAPTSIIGRLGHARIGWLVAGIDEDEAREAALKAGGPHAFAEAARLDQCPGAIHMALYQLQAALGDAGLP